MNRAEFYDLFEALLTTECQSVEEVFAMGKTMTKALEEAILHSAIEVYEREGQ